MDLDIQILARLSPAYDLVLIGTKSKDSKNKK